MSFSEAWKNAKPVKASELKNKNEMPDKKKSTQTKSTFFNNTEKENK